MATPRTGRPRGRPKGARNKRTAEELATAEARAAEALGISRAQEVFTGDAHALLMTIYKDTSLDLHVRREQRSGLRSPHLPRACPNKGAPIRPPTLPAGRNCWRNSRAL